MLEELASKLICPDSLICDPVANEPYSHDETALREPPLAVLMADNVEDILTTVKYCIAHKVAITPRGAGTGLSGGCVPSPRAIVISTERMLDLDIYPPEKLAICGPGVITKDLADSANQLGLTYPPDPASYEESTLGGNVAENAGGLRCKRFGLTRDYVLGVEAVDGRGELLQTGYFSSTEGLLLGDLLIGSEGTLGIITRLALRLIDLPEPGQTILVTFDRPEDAAKAVSTMTSSGLIPTVMEYIDRDSAALSNEYQRTQGIDNAAAVLLIETSASEQSEAIKAICKANRCNYLRLESDPVKAEELWQVRRNIAKAAKLAAKVKLSEDIAVPNSKFPEMVAFVDELNRNSDIRINSFGHAGDGNLHVNLLGIGDRPEEAVAIEQAVRAILSRAIELGGTLSGEHGIGLTKRDFISLEYDAATLSFMKAFKEILDPHGILNPGKIFRAK